MQKEKKLSSAIEESFALVAPLTIRTPISHPLKHTHDLLTAESVSRFTRGFLVAAFFGCSFFLRGGFLGLSPLNKAAASSSELSSKDLRSRFVRRERPMCLSLLAIPYMVHHERTRSVNFSKTARESLHARNRQKKGRENKTPN
jgi:hypothetical protein